MTKTERVLVMVGIVALALALAFRTPEDCTYEWEMLELRAQLIGLCELNGRGCVDDKQELHRKFVRAGTLALACEDGMTPPLSSWILEPHHLWNRNPLLNSMHTIASSRSVRLCDCDYDGCAVHNTVLHTDNLPQCRRF